MTVLRDVLKPGLRVVFCGTAAGKKSAQDSKYYANKKNRFWKILSETELTPRKLDPDEYCNLPKYGIGLTDLVKSRSGRDSQLSISNFDVDGFRAKIEKYQPKAVAFNGKEAARIFYNLKRTKEVDYGRQPEQIGRTVVFVLPSTSGSAGAHWKEEYWKELEEFVRE